MIMRSLIWALLLIETCGIAEVLADPVQHTECTTIRLPETIVTSGCYVIDQDFNIDEGTAIEISAENVRIDLRGYTISSDPSLGSVDELTQVTV